MAISIALPSALQPHARGIGVVKVESRGTTLRDALAALRVTYPGIVERVLTEQGAVREHVNLFIGEENSRLIGGLEAPAADGDTIEIVPSVSGGEERGAAPGRVSRSAHPRPHRGTASADGSSRHCDAARRCRAGCRARASRWRRTPP